MKNAVYTFLNNVLYYFLLNICIHKITLSFVKIEQFVTEYY